MGGRLRPRGLPHVVRGLAVDSELVMTVRFLEESPGVLSMARLAAFLQTVAGFLVQLAAVVVAIRDGEHAAGIIAALSAGSAACFAGAWAALKERHKPDGAPGIEGV